MPDELLAKLGEPPTDVLLKTGWWGRMLELLQVGVIGGRRWVGLMRDARGNARTVVRLMPEVIKASAAAILLAEDKPRRAR